VGTNEKRKRANKKQAAILAATVIAIICGLLFYLNRSRGTARVDFRKADGSYTQPFYLEVAKTEGQRRRGLMFRKSLPYNGGMIFIFPKEEVRSFWMMNTYVSLDMIFLSSDWKVQGILESVPILNEEPRRIDKPSKYVIELPAGSAKKYGIEPGQVARVPSELQRGKGAG
jgi:uncharacterized membrane protein (UPF0127 family)